MFAKVKDRLSSASTRRKKELNGYAGMANEASGQRQGLLSGRKSVSPPAVAVGEQDAVSVKTHGVIKSGSKQSAALDSARRTSPVPLGNSPMANIPTPASKKRLTYGSKVAHGQNQGVKEINGQDVGLVTVAMHTPNQYRTYLVHCVLPDDNWTRISLRYHVEVQDIKLANSLHQSDSIHMKTDLLIPTNEENMNFENEKLTLADLKREKKEEAEAVAEAGGPKLEEPDLDLVPATEIGRPIKQASNSFFAKFDAKFSVTKEVTKDITALESQPAGDAKALYEKVPRGAPQKTGAMGAIFSKKYSPPPKPVSRIGAGVAGDTSGTSYQNT